MASEISTDSGKVQNIVTIDASRNYREFFGSCNDMDGCLKFIYRTNKTKSGKKRALRQEFLPSAVRSLCVDQIIINDFCCRFFNCVHPPYPKYLILSF